jgi:hypothetical protein
LLNNNYRAFFAGKNLNGVDLSVRVLTTGFWPGQNAPPHINLARIPQQVSHIQQTDFYMYFPVFFYFNPLFILETHF